MRIDSRTTFEVWERMIYDETLSNAVFAGTYRELAKQRGYGDEQIAVLDWFAAQPGMRWNVENLRFRTALETAGCLEMHLPKTARLLTRGDNDWLQDICYEYLSYYTWDALGHRRLTECERFGRYFHERIAKRRILPAHLGEVLELELAIVDVLRQTALIPRDGWPMPPALDGDAPARIRPRRGPAQRVLVQAVDLRAVMTAEKPDRIDAGPGPVTWLVHVASPLQNPRMKIIADGARMILDRCDGEHTTAEIASAMAAEFALPAERVSQIIVTWLRDGVLVA